MTTEKAKNTPSPLHQHLDFTDEDLAENERGRLTERQQQRLGRQAWSDLAFVWGFAGVMAMITIGLSLSFLPLTNIGNLVGWGVMMVMLVVIIAGAVVVGWLRWQTVHKELASLDGQLKSLVGPVNVYLRRPQSGRGVIGAMISVQGESLEIPRRALFAFKNRAYYQVFVTKASNEILSASQIMIGKSGIQEKMTQDALGMQGDDLTTNREGRLTDSQRKKLRGSIISFLYYVFLILILGLFGPVMISIGQISLLPGIVFTGAVPVLLWLLLTPWVDAWRGTVLAAEGLPQFQGGNASRVIIKDRVLKVPADAALFFNPDMVHRVYYTPITKTIVAAEWVQSAK